MRVSTSEHARPSTTTSIAHIRRQVIFLLLSITPEAVIETMIIPLFPFLVRHLLILQNQQQTASGSTSPPNSNTTTTEIESLVGYYSGLLGSAFYAPAFVTNTLWGGLSDHIGRKPVLLASLSVLSLATFVLGISQTFWVAYACRFVTGVFGGSSTVAKGMLGEVTEKVQSGEGEGEGGQKEDKGLRGWAYAMYGVVYGVAGIVGPMLGAVVADPVKRFPAWIIGSPPGGVNETTTMGVALGLGTTKNSLYAFLEGNPYFVACLLGMMMAVLGLAVTVVFLEEPRSKSSEASTSSLRYTKVRNVDDGEDEEEDDDDDTAVDMDLDMEASGMGISMKPIKKHNPLAPPSNSFPTSSTTSLRSVLGTFTRLPSRTWYPIFLYCTIATVNMMYVTALPLFFSAPLGEGGGLSLTPNETSFAMTTVAICKLVVQLFAFEIFLGRLGIVRCYQVGMALYIPANILIPLVAYTPASGTMWWIRWVCLIPLLLLLGVSE
ncbi:hypothetical protein HK102_009827, partial [Quaeritorhiza haematococci]